MLFFSKLNLKNAIFYAALNKLFYLFQLYCYWLVCRHCIAHSIICCYISGLFCPSSRWTYVTAWSIVGPPFWIDNLLSLTTDHFNLRKPNIATKTGLYWTQGWYHRVCQKLSYHMLSSCLKAIVSCSYIWLVSEECCIWAFDGQQKLLVYPQYVVFSYKRFKYRICDVWVWSCLKAPLTRLHGFSNKSRISLQSQVR